MNPILQKNIFFVKEHVGLFKASSNFDIYDPTSQQMIMTCREENLGFFTKLFRFTDYKRMTPFDITIKTAEGAKVIAVRRGVSLFLSTVEVLDENDMVIGKFKQKFFSIGGKFEVLDAQERSLCMLKGHWASWDFKFVSSDNREFASVSKKWSGFGKEFFTSADNYVLQISPDVPENSPLRQLILAAVMCIDFVLKE
ncbi:phospholipid scramblase-related protein [Pseudochryseolinea flava]|uniref:RNAase n=1 Tax=Pseudochryseolinea flava TaxID=2059302 RepID=A0A364YA67_9BACT|nr:phospholipid scramblase-related protein [Pseudochryseolinea flava]RAW02778.1 RNAase [Pseudochryseolinea flava]